MISQIELDASISFPLQNPNVYVKTILCESGIQHHLMNQNSRRCHSGHSINLYDQYLQINNGIIRSEKLKRSITQNPSLMLSKQDWCSLHSSDHSPALYAQGGCP